MFHGVVNESYVDRVFQETETYQISIIDFRKILKSCANKYKFIRLADVDKYISGEAEEPGVLITFDDGVASVCGEVLNVLKEFKASAVVFVTTDFIDQGIVPAIFQLEKELLTRIPTTLMVDTPKYTASYQFNNPKSIGDGLSKLWGDLFREHIPPLSLKMCDFMFDRVPWATTLSSFNVAWEPASWENLRVAVDSGILEIGAHGKSHKPWTWMTQNELDRELHESKVRLEAEFKVIVNSCAIPHGCQNELVIKTVGNSFKYTFSSQSGLVGKNTTMTNIPRYHIPSEHPNNLWSVIDYPLLGRILRKLNEVVSNNYSRLLDFFQRNMNGDKKSRN